MMKITIIMVTIMITIIIINNNNVNKSNDSNVTLDVRPVMWSSPLMITGQTNPKERDRKVRAKVCTCMRVYAAR